MKEKLILEVRIETAIRENEIEDWARDRVFDALYNSLCKGNEDTNFEILESYTDFQMYD